LIACEAARRALYGIAYSEDISNADPEFIFE